MRPWARCLLRAAAVVAVTPVLLAQQRVDPLVGARQAYNERQFDRAVALAIEARQTPAQADSASLVLSRALLERFRLAGDVVDVATARQALLSVRPTRLVASEVVELHLGTAELLFVDEEFGAATELFEAALDRPGFVPDRQRDRVLEWWAASLDRYAQLAPDTHRVARYQRMLTRLEQEAIRGSASPAVVYWLAAAARGADDPDRAWSLVIAAWIQAPMIAGGQAGTFRSDLDRLMVDAIIPERAQHAAAEVDRDALKAALAAEWKAIKEKWGSREVA